MRGAATESADLALVLVAVDAGIQPQTREVVRRCARRRQPVVFLVNKVDVLLLPAADVSAGEGAGVSEGESGGGGGSAAGGGEAAALAAFEAAGGLDAAATRPAVRALREEMRALWAAEVATAAEAAELGAAEAATVA